MRLRPFVFLAMLAMLSSCGAPQLSDRTRSNLEELDGYVASRPVYETRKKGQLDALRKLLQASSDPVRRYDISRDMANEYFVNTAAGAEARCGYRGTHRLENRCT